MPVTWKTDLIFVIHKKGRKDECKNYRGITVITIDLVGYMGKSLNITWKKVIQEKKLRSRQVSGLEDLQLIMYL